MANEIQIYVACLASYNNGILHGKWIDATQDRDAMQQEISEMLKTSPIDNAEEWAIHDYEGFGKLRLSEWESLDSIHDTALFIENHGEIAIALLCEYTSDIEEARKALEENYCGVFKNLGDFAEDINEYHEIPSFIYNYIDYDRMGEDMVMSGDIFSIEMKFDELHIFWSR